MIVLDTDHASELGFRSVAGIRLLHRLGAGGGDAVITAITVKEQMRGWRAEIRRRTDTHVRGWQRARAVAASRI